MYSDLDPSLAERLTSRGRRYQHPRDERRRRDQYESSSATSRRRRSREYDNDQYETHGKYAKYEYRESRRDYHNESRYRVDKRESSRSHSREYDDARYERRSRRARDADYERRDDLPPLSEWSRKKSLWDIAPKGFEHLNPIQVKATGLFPPGTVGTPFASQSQDALGSNGSVNLPNSKQAKKVYVGNVAVDTDVDELKFFFNDTMKKIPGVSSSKLVVNIQPFFEKNFAFVEFETAEDATLAMGLDGYEFHGAALKLRRPKDYVGPVGTDLTALRTQQSQNDERIVVEHIPIYLEESQIKRLLQTFGDLQSFDLVKTKDGTSTGFAYCQYKSPNITDLACDNLSGLQIGKETIKVSRVIPKTLGGIDPSLIPASSIINILTAVRPGQFRLSPVLQFLNMITIEELENEVLYEEIIEDVKQECEMYGKVEEIIAPRPSEDGTPVAGVERVSSKQLFIDLLTLYRYM